MMERKPDYWMTRRKRGNHNFRAGRCAWIEDATKPQACGKSISLDKAGYCSKHQRMFEAFLKDQTTPPKTDKEK